MIQVFFMRGKKARSVLREKLARGIVAHHRSQVTAFDLSTAPPTLIRRDIALGVLDISGAKLPELYFDELGNMIRSSDFSVVMAGPAMSNNL